MTKKNSFKKITIVVAMLAVLSVIFLPRLYRRPTNKQPNIILLIIDALRPDHLACYGYPRKTSPFLCRLSQKGTLFENVVSQSSWTKTSIPSMLSSLYPEAHGVRGNKDVLPDTVLLLPEVLKEHGYRTYCAHGNPWMEKRFGFNQGYDKFVYVRGKRKYPDGTELNKQALDWLDEEKNQPFFLYIHYMDVHQPYMPPRKFNIFGNSKEGKYDGEILYADSKIAELFRELEKRDLVENTWTIITADHGEEFGDHGGMSHGRTLYAEVLRVPLIFHYAGAKNKGKRVKRQVRLIDVSPTILDLVGITIPKSMEGVSLEKNIIGSANLQREDLEAFSQVGLNGPAPNKDLIAVTTPEFKYIFDFISKKEELYDLSTDSEEKHNIALSKPRIVKTFREKVAQFKQLQKEKVSSFIKKAEIDEDLAKQLKSLGYLE